MSQSEKSRGEGRGNGESRDATATENAALETPAGEAEQAAGDALPSSGLLSFYDRLRGRVVDTVERRGGRLGTGVADALLLAPDVFMLLVRLTLDKQVPKETRTLIGGALAYFVLPFDLLPEVIVGPAGYVDDLILSLAVLAQAFGGELEPIAEKHWSGPKSVRVVLADVLGTARHLLGHNVYERLRGLLEKRGVDLDEATSQPR